MIDETSWVASSGGVFEGLLKCKIEYSLKWLDGVLGASN